MVKESEERKVGTRDVVDLSRMKEEVDKLRKIEKKLNEKINKKEFREELFKNPIHVLRQEGVILPKDKEKSITEFFNSVKVPQEAEAELRAMQTLKGDWGIFVSISIDW